MFVRRLFLTIVFVSALAFALLAPWMGWMMRIRVLEAGLTLGFWDWTAFVLWGLYGPFTLAITTNVVMRVWNDTRQ